MKKAEEWIRNEPKIEAGAPFICATENVIEQIQLDALKQGMSDASEIIGYDNILERSSEEWGLLSRILTARDNKTSL